MQTQRAQNKLLKATSRSFYLTLRVLPARVRPQIGLAYLLARTADTIADTEVVQLEQRLVALQNLRDRVMGNYSAPLNLGEIARRHSLSADRILLERADDGVAQLQLLSPADLKFVRDVFTTITSGQELDLRRFESDRVGNAPRVPELANNARYGGGCAPGQRQIIALQSDAELDDYTYRVAGCVGEFWTKICRGNLFPHALLDESQFVADGVQFGKGLQLVNILRDLPVDLRKGRCYLPFNQLADAGLSPEDLLSPTCEARVRPVYDHYLDLAESCLAAGWNYTETIPRGQVRVRLACAWPILIGVRTLGQLRTGSVLDPQRRIKISRCEVWEILLRSTLSYPFSRTWRNLFSATGKAVASHSNLP